MGQTTRRTILGAVGVAWLLAAGVYILSQNALTRQHAVEIRNVPLATDPALLQEGARLARAYGCNDCHGDRFQGQVLEEFALGGQLVAPNLTRLATNRRLPEMEAAIRQGVKPDGTSVIGMPSRALATLTDRELGAILGHLRSVPVLPDNPGVTEPGLAFRWRLVAGGLPVQAEAVYLFPWAETFREDQLRQGEYIATVACAQCHGLDLEGEGDAPSLDRIYDYDRFEFTRLLEEGLAPGDREAGRMSETARKRFGHLTKDEVNSLYVFLKSRP